MLGDFFAFRTMISGTVIQVIFALGLIGIVIGAIGAIANDEALFGILLLVFGTLYWRVVCEFIIVVFRMDASPPGEFETTSIRRQAELAGQARA